MDMIQLFVVLHDVIKLYHDLWKFFLLACQCQSNVYHSWFTLESCLADINYQCVNYLTVLAFMLMKNFPDIRLRHSIFTVSGD